MVKTPHLGRRFGSYLRDVGDAVPYRAGAMTGVRGIPASGREVGTPPLQDTPTAPHTVRHAETL